jgi:sortase A
VSRSGDAVRTFLRGTGQLLITLGVVVLLFCVYELKVTNLVTAQAQEELSEELRRTWAEPAARTAEPAPSPTSVPSAPPVGAPTPRATPPPPAPPQPPPPAEVELGSGMAVLRIPRLGDWNDEPPVVVEGVRVADLKTGPGHMPGTALPGELGNLVVSGHRTTYGAPFSRLDELEVGDPVVVETRDAWFTYTVTGARVVSPSAVEVAWPVPGQAGATPTRRLMTMTTCHPRYSARSRLIVSAELTATDAKPGGPPAALGSLAAAGGGS